MNKNNKRRKGSLTNEMIDKIGEKTSIQICAKSPINDDWINQLKTYCDIVADEQFVMGFFLSSIAFYIELLLQRIDDMVNKEDLEKIEKVMVHKIAEFEALLANSKTKSETETHKFFVKAVYTFLLSLRKYRKEHSTLTTAQCHYELMVKKYNISWFKRGLYKKALSNYIENQVKTFEEANLRNIVASIIE